MVVSLGANKKRILAVLVLIAIAVSAFFLIPRGEKRQTFPGMTGEERLAFLTSFGWEAEAEPQDVREVVIPAKFNDVYAAYNTMQQAQGFDLLPYAGEKVHAVPLPHHKLPEYARRRLRNAPRL